MFLELTKFKTRESAYTIEARLVDVVPRLRDMALERYSDNGRCGPQHDYQADDKTRSAVEG